MEGSFWCDGLSIEEYGIREELPYLAGWVDITAEQRWRLAILLPRQFDAISDIDWARLLPATGERCRIWYDRHRREMEIDLRQRPK